MASRKRPSSDAQGLLFPALSDPPKPLIASDPLPKIIPETVTQAIGQGFNTWDKLVAHFGRDPRIHAPLGRVVSWLESQKKIWLDPSDQWHLGEEPPRLQASSPPVPRSVITAHSYERYNGGAKIKRLHGSSTVTRFFVYRAEDARNPTAWIKVEGYGKTPGDRRTDAIRRSGLRD